MVKYPLNGTIVLTFLKMKAMNNDKQRNGHNDKLRDNADFEPIGGLYDDKRDHGSGNTQHADEGTLERDQKGNIGAQHGTNAAGSPTRGHSSDGDAAAGHGNQ
jgi:hypothetical protein